MSDEQKDKQEDTESDDKVTEADRLLLHVVHHAKLLLCSNTLWLTLAWVGFEFGRNIDASWLAAHPGFKTWLPPILAAAGIIVKILQNTHENKRITEHRDYN